MFSLTNVKLQLAYFHIHFVCSLMCDGVVTGSTRDGIGREMQMEWHIHNILHNTVLKTDYIFVLKRK